MYCTHEREKPLRAELRVHGLFVLKLIYTGSGWSFQIINP